MMQYDDLVPDTDSARLAPTSRVRNSMLRDNTAQRLILNDLAAPTLSDDRSYDDSMIYTGKAFSLPESKFDDADTVSESISNDSVATDLLSHMDQLPAHFYRHCCCTSFIFEDVFLSRPPNDIEVEVSSIMAENDESVKTDTPSENANLAGNGNLNLTPTSQSFYSWEEQHQGRQDDFSVTELSWQSQHWNICVLALPFFEGVPEASSHGAYFHISEVEHTEAPTLFQNIEKEDWTSAVDRLESHPHESSIWVYKNAKHDALNSSHVEPLCWRILPIHAACIFGSSSNVIKLLIQAYPPSVTCVDLSGKLPLHIACYLCFSAKVVKVLLEASPHSIYATDSLGEHPITLALQSNGPERNSVLGVLQDGISKVMNMSHNDPMKMKMLKEMRSLIFSFG